ncbi:MAG: SPOR domain-containing protein, partial [Desulfuromonadales bacterium]|nr:SPOR domain-containing protein [Desulfuromonadales bacterium]
TEDEIQFDFEEDDKLPFDDDDGFVDDGFTEKDMEEELPRKGLSQRSLLLILLLLLALGGGAYYYLNGTPEPAPQPAPVKAKVAVEPPTPKPVEVKPETPVAAAPVPAQELQTATPVVPEKVASPPAETVATAPASTPAPPVPSEVKNDVVPAPVGKQPFTLNAGAFLSKENQQEVEKKIRRLGYTPKVQTVSAAVSMTRLLLGIYDDPAAAQARSREWSTLIPNLFSLQEGDKVALYAGSFQSVEQARKYADKLYQQGILADEETVSMQMSMKKISFGSFANRAEAENAAKRAAAAGLSAQVAKR